MNLCQNPHHVILQVPRLQIFEVLFPPQIYSTIAEPQPEIWATGLTLRVLDMLSETLQTQLSSQQFHL